MNQKQIDFTYFGILVLMVILPEAIAGVSGWEVFADARLIAVLMCLLPVGTGWMLHNYIRRTGFDLRIQQEMKICAIFIGVVCWINAGVHFVHSREMSAAAKGFSETQAAQKAASEQAKELLDKMQKLSQTETNRLRQMPADSKARSRSSLPSLSLPSLTISESGWNSPDKIREKNMFWILLAAGMVIASCVLGLGRAQWLYVADSDNNGTADWQDRRDSVNITQSQAPKDPPRERLM